MSSPLGVQLISYINEQNYAKICTLLADQPINLDERDEVNYDLDYHVFTLYATVYHK